LPKKGRFYLCCTTHAFAVVDGVVYDNLYRPKSRARMAHAFEITTVAKDAPLQIPVAHGLPEPKPTPKVAWPPAPLAHPIVAKPYTPAQTPAEKLSQQDISELWERLNRLESK